MGKGSRNKRKRAEDWSRKSALKQVKAGLGLLLSQPTLEAMRRGILKSGAQIDSCILSTKVWVTLAERMGLDAYPMVVECTAMNPAMTSFMDSINRDGNATESLASIEPGELAKSGARMVVLGARDDREPAGPNSWPGHLVACVTHDGESWGVDLSLDQAQRPKKRLLLKPLAFRLTKGWLKGEQIAQVRRRTVDGEIAIEYAAFPYDTSYQDSPDWARDWMPGLEMDERGIRFTMEAPK